MNSVRKTTVKLVISFASITSAVATETACNEAGIAGRLIPTPREISAGCGLSWSCAPETELQITALLEQKKISWQHMRLIEFK